MIDKGGRANIDLTGWGRELLRAVFNPLARKPLPHGWGGSNKYTYKRRQMG